MKSPGEIILHYVQAFKAHTGCNPPVIEYRFGKYVVTFANGDRETWAESKLRQFTSAWNGSLS